VGRQYFKPVCNSLYKLRKAPANRGDCMQILCSSFGRSATVLCF